MDIPLVTTYHVFTDQRDEFVKTRKEADAIYKNWRDDGFVNIRLYKEQSDKDGEEVEENYVKGCGEYPY